MLSFNYNLIFPWCSGNKDDCHSKAHNYESVELATGVYDVPENKYAFY